MSDSDSSLSSTHSTDDEALIAKMSKLSGINRYFKPKVEKEPSPEPPKRAPSPPHDYILADNDSIAFVVMFRSRFSDAFPKSLQHYGPQDIERGLVGEYPDEHVERLLCALLGLVLNRKKDVERGHYGRALEDAITTNKHQWPAAWNGVNPLPGDKTFNTMTAEERLVLLRALVLWALNSSDSIQAMIKEAYKQTRRDDDKNQAKSVQPWFSDSYRRKYYLIEGQDDTHFRVYRENDGKTKKTNTWFSVAGSIEEINVLAEKFEQEGTSVAKINREKIRGAVARFEVGEEKRKRKEYRLARKAQFSRPEPGFSLYEGRTRGKRMRYTFSDGEEEDSDVHSGRRSLRNSGYATPLENGPVTTMSGRQVKARVGGAYGESMLVDQKAELDRSRQASYSADAGDDSSVANIKQSRSGRPLKSARGRYAEGLESESESDAHQPSEKEWSGDENEPDDESEPEFEDGEDDDDDMGEVAQVDDDDENTQESLVVQLRYRPGTQTNGSNGDHTSESQRLPDPDTKTYVTPHLPSPSSLINGTATGNGVNGLDGEHTSSSDHVETHTPAQSQQTNNVETIQAMDLS